MNKHRILLIDDNPERLKIIKQSLAAKNLRHSSISPIFDNETFEFYPKDQNIDDFCKSVSKLNSIDLYFMIYKYIEDNSIDAIFTDLTFNDDDMIGSSSGEKLINNLLKDNLHQELPIVAYSRKSNKQANLNVNIRAKIKYVFVGTEINDASAIRRKFNQNGLEHEIITDQIKNYRNNKLLFDLAVICALYKEYEAVKTLSKNWETVNDTIKKTYWENKDKGVILKVALTCMNNEMGMVEASLRTLDLINFTKPKLVAMTGIAGGSKKNQARLGDICVAKTIDNWQSGKYKTGGRFELSPEIKEINIRIKTLIENRYIKDDNMDSIVDGIITSYGKDKINELIKKEIERDIKYLENITNIEEKEKFKESIRKEVRLPKFKFVDMMTGASLVADEEIINKGMLERNRKAYAFDMEGYAVARVSYTKEVNWIVIKTIVDYGNDQKDDDWHDFASFSSAKILYHLSFDILNNSLSTHTQL